MNVPIDSVRPDPGQPRKVFSPEPLAELADSISSLGLVEPLVVRPVDGMLTIVAGERRWRASRLAGLTEVPVIVREDLDDQGAFEVAMVENVIRVDLNAVEEANGYQRLLAAGLTVEQMSKRLGKTAHAIRSTLSLLKLEPAILDLVAKGHLTAWDGSRLATLTWNSQHMALRLIQQNGLTGNDRDRVIGQLWCSERSQGMFADDAVPATDPRRREVGRSLRSDVERAAALLGHAEELLGTAAFDDTTIALIEGISKMSVRLLREALQARALTLVVDQLGMVAA